MLASLAESFNAGLDGLRIRGKLAERAFSITRGRCMCKGGHTSNTEAADLLDEVRNLLRVASRASAGAQEKMRIESIKRH